MSRRLTVLQSFPEPRATTNPYVVTLRRSLDARPDLEVLTFSWSRALRARYDVLHVHWPENLLKGGTRGRALARRLLFVALLARLTLRSTPVVATVHNLRPQEGLPRSQRFLLGLLGRRVAVRVLLNEQTLVPPGTAAVTVLHGHYREWFADHPRPPREPGRVAYVGLIRPYKDVGRLIRVFGTTADAAPSARLQVAGQPLTPELADELHAAAAADPRVELTLEFLPDDRLVDAVGRATLVALPYREMHNSGAALMALSLDRPVLVPRNPVTDLLAAEVGEEWVHRYDGELSGAVLLQALQQAADHEPGLRPDLGRREWDQAGRDHEDAYRWAVRLRGRRRDADPEPH
ncbi:GDP-mannose--glycolipid 4-beta-D-mannosyltransferase [Modestobacter marinus]|uniref:GDP-mannose:glycolipid 4-beta-D-mannosyltransferase n=1 Tax=Modestobacter marinus TaxID=477641 RepID=A0A846LR14_9ACTN|nr:glycosyl transferase [Modestobacter marinus]NIH65929.1 glycosyltransferase involved in cell wall biosynthesis [Modestobacter marinus]GGL68177.1 GDP-mannose:glycolipid 4-beta-D-mannosyltransferase [Modestobacter marinus]